MHLNDIEQKLSTFNSHDRCYALIDIFCVLEPSDIHDRLFWNVLSHFWRSFDLIDHQAIQNLMSVFPYDEQYLHTSVVRPSQLFRSSKFINAYRGQKDFKEDQEIVRGLSWTTDPAIAKRFAEYGFRGITRGNSYIQVTHFKQHDVAFYDDSRNEKELVIFNMHHDVANVEKLDYVKSIFED